MNSPIITGGVSIESILQKNKSGPERDDDIGEITRIRSFPRDELKLNGSVTIWLNQSKHSILDAFGI